MEVRFTKHLLMLSMRLIAAGVLVVSARLEASAPMSCSPGSAASLARADGVTELVSDAVVMCAGGAPTAAGQPIPLANIRVSSNALLTNRINADGTSDALLLINDPLPAGLFNSSFQKFCTANGVTSCALNGTGGSPSPYLNTKNIFQGVSTVVNGVAYLDFLGVPIDPPGSFGPLKIRIANLRADVTHLAPGQSVTVTVSISGYSPVSAGTVAYVVPGLAAGGNCTYDPLGHLVACPGTASQINVGGSEGFASSFKTAVTTTNYQGMIGGTIQTQTVPGVDYISESGLTLSATPLPYSGVGNGEASHGTWLTVSLLNIPPGVHITAPGVVIGSSAAGPSLTLYRVDAPPSAWQFKPAFYSAIPTDKLLLDTTGANPPTSATAIYEVVADDQTRLESFNIPFAVTTNGAPLDGIKTTLGLGPLVPEAPSASGAGMSWELPSSSYDVPRFLGGSVAQFGDVPSSAAYFDAANLMFQTGITLGCSQSTTAQARLFCPANALTRQEMAAFIVRAVTGSSVPAVFNPTPQFVDVPDTNPFFAHIQKLADLGITTGCAKGAGMFCPTDLVPRWQMAMFMVRARLALNGSNFTTEQATPYFADVPTNVEGSGVPYPFIQRSYEEHISNGCASNPLIFCPDTFVTRGQMASFVMRALFNQTPVVALNAQRLVGVSPNTVGATEGNQLLITIGAVNTNFQSGDTVTVPSGMLTVSNVVVTSATTLTATLTVAASAVPGPQALVVTTGGHHLTLPLAIRVGTY